jgi:membrane associated rhomboid family serine protease
MIGFMGKGIQNSVGGKYVFWLYGLGALFGGLSSVAFQRPSPYIQPQVGPESCLGAFITFLAMLNPRQTFLIVFPIPAWMLVTIIGLYSLIFDPQKKYFSGITAGLAVFQMRRVGFL